MNRKNHDDARDTSKSNDSHELAQAYQRGGNDLAGTAAAMRRAGVSADKIRQTLRRMARDE